MLIPKALNIWIPWYEPEPEIQNFLIPLLSLNGDVESISSPAYRHVDR